MTLFAYLKAGFKNESLVSFMVFDATLYGLLPKVITCVMLAASSNAGLKNK